MTVEASVGPISVPTVPPPGDLPKGPDISAEIKALVDKANGLPADLLASAIRGELEVRAAKARGEAFKAHPTKVESAPVHSSSKK